MVPQGPAPMRTVTAHPLQDNENQDAQGNGNHGIGIQAVARGMLDSGNRFRSLAFFRRGVFFQKMKHD